MNQSKKIASSRCWVDGKLQPATICMEQGKITAVHFSKDQDAEDAGDKVIMPGVIDAHVHINEPGRTEWEGFNTATKSAAAGGTTTVVDMPLNSSPVTINKIAFEEKINASAGQLHINTGFYGGVVPGNIHELEGLIQSGVMGIKCFLTHSGIDEFPNVTEKDLDEAMPIIARHDIPLLVHAELDSDADHTLNENPTSYAAFVLSRPKQWENKAIELMIRLCRKHRCRVHIVHVSSAEALPLIAAAKKEGLPLTAETCAHYLYFNAENIPDGRCIYKCAPPIREKTNNRLLIEALETGVLDFITTDHSPAPPGIKEIESGNLKNAWGGIAGIQFLLPASWTSLKDSMQLEKFIPLITENPACFLGLEKKKGKIAAGYDADLVVWEPEVSHQIEAEEILFRYRISPYIGESLYGSVNQTIVNEIAVCQQSQIIYKNAGQCLFHP